MQGVVLIVVQSGKIFDDFFSREKISRKEKIKFFFYLKIWFRI